MPPSMPADSPPAPVAQQPRYVRVKLALMHELNQNRPLILNWSRLATDPATGNTWLLGHHTLVCRPDQELGRFVVDTVPDDDLWQTPGLVVDCHSVVELDAQGRPRPPRAACSERERGFFSVDERTFLQATLDSSIEHLVLCHTSAKPPFFSDATAVAAPAPDDRDDRDDQADGIRQCLQHIFLTDTLTPEQQEERYRFEIAAPVRELGDPEYSLLASGDLAVEYADMRSTAARLRMLDPDDTAWLPRGPMPFALTGFRAGTAEQAHALARKTADASRKPPRGRRRDTAAPPVPSGPDRLARFDRTRARMLRLQRVNDAIVLEAKRLLRSPIPSRQQETLQTIVDYFADHPESVPRDPAVDSCDIEDHIDHRNEYFRNRSLIYLKVVDSTTPGQRTLDRANTVLGHLACLMVLSENQETRDATAQHWLRTSRGVVGLEESMSAGEGSVLGLSRHKRLADMNAALSHGAGGPVDYLDRQTCSRRLGDQRRALVLACRSLLGAARDARVSSHCSDTMAARLKDVFATSWEGRVLGLASMDLSRRRLNIDHQIARVRRALKNVELMQHSPGFDPDTADWPLTHRLLMIRALREYYILRQMLALCQGPPAGGDHAARPSSQSPPVAKTPAGAARPA